MTGMETDVIGIHWSSCRNYRYPKTITASDTKIPERKHDKKKKYFFSSSSSSFFFATKVMDIGCVGGGDLNFRCPHEDLQYTNK